MDRRGPLGRKKIVACFAQTRLMHCYFCSKMVSAYVTKGSLGYLSSMYFSTSLVLGEVVGPFPEIES